MIKQLIKKALRIKSPTGDQLNRVRISKKSDMTMFDEVNGLSFEQMMDLFKKEETEKAHKHFFQLVDRFEFLLHRYLVFKCDCGEFCSVSEQKFYGRMPKQTWSSNSTPISRKP